MSLHILELIQENVCKESCAEGKSFTELKPGDGYSTPKVRSPWKSVKQGERDDAACGPSPMNRHKYC